RAGAGRSMTAILTSVLLALALQSAAIGPRGGSSNPDACSIRELTGQLVFPAFVAPVHFVDIELKALDNPYSSTLEATTGPYEQFQFYSLQSGPYEVSITMAGMDTV